MAQHPRKSVAIPLGLKRKKRDGPALFRGEFLDLEMALQGFRPALHRLRRAIDLIRLARRLAVIAALGEIRRGGFGDRGDGSGRCSGHGGDA